MAYWLAAVTVYALGLVVLLILADDLDRSLLTGRIGGHADQRRAIIYLALWPISCLIAAIRAIIERDRPV